ncbi:PGPGW domain-containing protein [Thermoflavimicrobium daqui]|uniref:DUF454 family protein n=1 Tax=Thermoflavimicrobium daqui TaxID=2137476 RepID=A0A364K6J9_9BACL|nr:PGPGW domain-containing protein [Thermoflavimicrobium daqui]RAL25907.1 hypothetical protein DL897_07475 [Thermoflavimicrobium daqui]
MKPAKWKTIGFTILGWIFIVIGIIGCFLPILQGWLFILIGLYFLSFSSTWAKSILNKLRNRFPKVAAKADQFISRWKKKFS